MNDRRSLAAERPPDDEAAMNYRGFVRTIRKRALLVAACAIGAGAAAFGVSMLQEDQYSAEASLLFRDPGFAQSLFGGDGFQGSGDPFREGETNERLVSLDVIARRTAGDVDLDEEEVSERIEVEADGESDVVTITATDADPARAAELANAFASNYVQFRRNADRRKVESAIRLVERQIAGMGTSEQEGEAGTDLKKQVNQLRTLAALQTGNAELVQRAAPPDERSSPKPLRNAVFGGLFGLVFGVGVALLLERFDRRIHGPDDLESAFSLPLLAHIPESKIFDDRRNGHDEIPFREQEAFRMLRTQLLYFNVDRHLKSILVTSASPGEGKSTVAWNLAMTAAAAGSSAILVEADLHNPQLAERHQVAPLPGLTEVLTGQGSLDGAIQTVAAGDGAPGRADRGLDVLVAGMTPPNPLELLESDEMAQLLRLLEERYELVVIDTPPSALLADAIPLMKLVSGVIVVGQLRKTTRDDASALRAQLDRVGAPILGVIANRGDRAGTAKYASYYYRGDRP